MNDGPLAELPLSSLRALADSLRVGPLALGMSRPALAGIVGPERAQAVVTYLEGLQAEGFTLPLLARTVEILAEARGRWPDPGQVLALVLSGPEMPGAIAADTATTVASLIEEAAGEILLLSYAVHQGQSLFERLAARMRVDPELKVRLYLDIARGQTDTSLEGEIIRRFLREFWTKQWPWPERPAILYDPRSLVMGSPARASFHAKGLIVDRRTAFLTSANFTTAAQDRNIEAGVLLRYPPLARQMAEHLEQLQNSGLLALCPTD